MNKQTMVNTLRVFVNQRPGLDFGNYGDMVAYHAESRAITKMRDEALTLIRYVEWHDSIEAEDIVKASQSAFNGRLTITGDTIDYCTGQYFPTEYRKAVACVMASVIRQWLRDNGHDTGDKIRKAARREFSRAIAQKYFN